jgi:hypothetical protein
MKKSRLLEIIREEISAVLHEGEAEEKAAKAAAIKAADLEIKALEKKKADMMKSGVAENTLEEDTLNEMAYDIIISQPNELAKLQDKIKDSTKKGEQKLAKALEIIQKTKKEGKPIRQRDIANEMGLIQQEINPLINKLIDVGILEKGESVTGVTKKKITDKPQGKPAKEKTAMVPKVEPKSPESDEAPAGDAEMEKAARGRDDLTIQYRGVMDTYKKMKAEEGDQAALEYLKTKQNIVKAYKKAQEVNI